MNSLRLKHSLLATACAVALSGGSAFATPSTHVWSPSTDIQADRTFHLTADMYIPSENDASGTKPNTVTNVGLETGLWGCDNKVGVEFGFDLINGYGDELDDHPLYLNAKAGSVEDAFFDMAPAMAVGIYNWGTSSETDVNSYYIEAARTLKVNDFNLGRVSFGWFWGNSDLLLDKHGNTDDNGMILAWERTMSELSDKLWLCVDYQGSDSGLGALAPGFSWKFADNVSVLFGYVIPNNSDLSETYTIQADVDF